MSDVELNLNAALACSIAENEMLRKENARLRRAASEVMRVKQRNKNLRKEVRRLTVLWSTAKQGWKDGVSGMERAHNYIPPREVLNVPEITQRFE